jgi:hypothetical protein
VFKNIDLETQYQGFNLCFWSMLIIASITSVFGNPVLAVMLGTLGLVSGAIGQLKLILINQTRIGDMLEVLLEGK